MTRREPAPSPGDSQGPAAAPATTLADVLAPFLATPAPDDPLVTVEEEHAAAAARGLRSRYDLAIVITPPTCGPG